ncbi:vesicle-associated protein 4-2-like [Trifolium pratense]|uniref:Vesicle-associated protein 4-2-like n=1 Tax=Trifolium pratense TaxID=57577 RepID=A0A2K3PQ25_TRIPR|nr:vesicle-associated protein 4-2-like [Trifolium pratense]
MNLFQTTAPKSCYMRPPGGILSPGESVIATVFKFVEPPENNEKPTDQKSKVKFKIMSLKVQGEMDYVPELFDEQRDQVAVEQILRVVFLDPDRNSPAMDKLKRQLAEAEAALEARKKPPEETGGPRVAGEGLVIDEWKERRERYLAKQQVEGVVVDSV